MGLFGGFGPQAMIDNQRLGPATAFPRPVMGQGTERHAVGAAGHSNGNHRRRLERAEPGHQSGKFVGAERRGHVSYSQRADSPSPPAA